ncbi:MAG: hypothetical protein IJ285_05660 [Clostridia bacterium]|nr:hypothetical protein [Oscillospiraceae bacterium]MBQ7960689.1 hypothetical protein [Clostridia bacterium]
MKIKTELIKGYVADAICNQLTDFEIDENAVADSRATLILDAVREILCQDELTDFEMIDEIVSLFGRCNIDCGSCHDF